VAAFFNTASTGFAATMNTYLNSLLDSNGSGTNGAVMAIENTLTSQNSGIDAQIAAIQRQLDSEKEQLTTSFEAMQSAQANAKSMTDLLKNTFSTSSSSSG
jgi:flagellar hook-associated protein 2